MKPMLALSYGPPYQGPALSTNEDPLALTHTNMDPPFDVEMKQILCQMGPKLVKREGRNGSQLRDLCHVTWFQPMRSWYFGWSIR